MALTQLVKKNDHFYCPKCDSELKFVDGGAVRVVGGKLDMDNIKPRYVCDNCGVFYREFMTTGYYDVFELEASEHEMPSPVAVPKAPDRDMKPKNKLHCPQCGEVLEGGSDYFAARSGFVSPDGREMTRHYSCKICNALYHEVVISGIHHTLVWFTEAQQTAVLKHKTEKNSEMGPGMVITPDNQPDVPTAKNAFFAALKEQTPPPNKPAYPLPGNNARSATKKPLLPTSELKPVQLKRDSNGRAECPRCGGSMKYIEGQPVRIVDGKPTFDDVLDHFNCPDCDSVFRRIVGTDYFQYSEK